MIENLEETEEDGWGRHQFYKKLTKTLENDMVEVGHQYRDPYCTKTTRDIKWDNSPNDRHVDCVCQ